MLSGFLNIIVVKFLDSSKLKVSEIFLPLGLCGVMNRSGLDLDLGPGLVAAFYFRNKIIKLAVLKLTNQNKRHYHFRFESVNQLVAFLTSVAPNWQRHSANAGSLKQRQNIADLLAVWLNEPQASQTHDSRNRSNILIFD